MTHVLVRFRRPVEADQPVLVELVDDWWGRRMQGQLPRLWFRHFTGTSLVAESPGGSIDGFVVGFVSPDHPDQAYLHLIGVAPGKRRRGLGRALVERFGAVAAERGATRLSTIAWPGDPVALEFLRATGFEVETQPGLQRLYGTPAHTDWDRQGDDQVMLTRPI